MPGNILNADTGFPRFSEGQSTDEKIRTIMNYLYMLLEQLRYSMGNLEASNFNEAGITELQEVITEPIYVELLDPETGLVTGLFATVDGLGTRMQDAEGDLSELTQTINGITIKVTDGENVTQVGTYSNGILLMTTGALQVAGMATFEELNAAPGSGRTTINGGWLRSESIEAPLILGGYVNGAIIHGDNGLYGPEVITRQSGGAPETSGDRTVYPFQQAKVNAGEVSFGIIKRDYNAPYAASPAVGAIPTPESIANGTMEPYGSIRADYSQGKLYLTTKGTLNKPLKLESGSDMSIDAVPRSGTPATIPGTGMAHGRIFIGGDQFDINGDVVQSGGYGQQVRLGGTAGQVVIYPAQGTSGLPGVWEFRTDGIYYNGARVVNSSVVV